VACDSADRTASPSEPTSTQPAMHHLDINHPTALKSITAGSDAKFVEVQVSQVSNPAQAALSFAVTYQSAGETIPLGSFSLYPADHPGTFIVPTQGKIASSGSIRVTMENPDNDARIRVTIGRIELVSHPESAPTSKGSSQ
jgi:hypothetical protein